jgi:hypothetical protein
VFTTNDFETGETQKKYEHKIFVVSLWIAFFQMQRYEKEGCNTNKKKRSVWTGVDRGKTCYGGFPFRTL